MNRGYLYSVHRQNIISKTKVISQRPYRIRTNTNYDKLPIGSIAQLAKSDLVFGLWPGLVSGLGLCMQDYKSLYPAVTTSDSPTDERTGIGKYTDAQRSTLYDKLNSFSVLMYSILNNELHVLQPLLPAKTSFCYNLRPHYHNRQLTRKSAHVSSAVCRHILSKRRVPTLRGYYTVSQKMHVTTSSTITWTVGVRL